MNAMLILQFFLFYLMHFFVCQRLGILSLLDWYIFICFSGIFYFLFVLGTGYGTGSTQQCWNVEQALMKQKSEEEHVTVLLLVLASYINPGGRAQEELADNVLPPNFYKLLGNSVLLPALCSYLRNDSGEFFRCFIWLIITFLNWTEHCKNGSFFFCSFIAFSSAMSFFCCLLIFFLFVVVH